MFPKLLFIYLFISNRLLIRERSLMAGSKFHYYINIHDEAIFWKNSYGETGQKLPEAHILHSIHLISLFANFGDSVLSILLSVTV